MSYTLESNTLSATVREVWGEGQGMAVGQEVSVALWSPGMAMSHDADTSRDFKFGEQIFLVATDSAHFETFLPLQTFQIKLKVLFSLLSVRDLVLSLRDDELVDWLRDYDLGESVLTEAISQRRGGQDVIVEQEARFKSPVLTDSTKFFLRGLDEKQRLELLERMLTHPSFSEKSYFVPKVKEVISGLSDLRLKGQRLFLNRLNADIPFHVLPMSLLLTKTFTERVIEENLSYLPIIQSKWCSLLRVQTHEEVETHFIHFWAQRDPSARKSMAPSLAPLLFYEKSFRGKLYELLVRELVRTLDPFYFEVLRPVIKDDRFFTMLKEPRAMKLAIELCSLVAKNSAFILFLKEHYLTCQENGVSFMKDEETRIKALIS